MAKKVKRKPIKKKEGPTISEVEEFIRRTPDEVFAKASAAAAYAVRDMVIYEDGVKQPKNIGDWIELYTKHVWAYAAVFVIASTAAQLKFKLYRWTPESEDREEIKAHPILDLLEKPNDSMTGYDLLESLFVYLETSGIGYWEIVYGQKLLGLGKKIIKADLKKPMELWPIRPDRLKPEPKKDGHGLEKWIYQTKPHAKKRDFAVEEIVPFRYFNPVNQWYGLGSLQPAIDDIRQDKQMAKWNLDFFTQGITPEGLLYTDKPMTKKEIKDIGEQMKASLAGKGRKVLVLSKNLKWQMISVPPKDIEFLAGRKENRQAILAAAGVPSVKVGLLDNAKYDNFRLQQEAFYRDTLLPKLKKVESALNSFLVTRFPDLTKEGESVWLEFDKSGLLREDADAVVKRVSAELEHGLLTPNEGREIRGRDPWPEGTGGDLFYMNSNIVPVGAAPEGEETEESLEMRADSVYQKVEALEKRLVGLVGGLKEKIKTEILKEVKSELEDE